MVRETPYFWNPGLKLKSKTAVKDFFPSCIPSLFSLVVGKTVPPSNSNCHRRGTKIKWMSRKGRWFPQRVFGE